MITVTNNDVKSINAALIANNEALKKEVSQTLDIENVKHADEADHATTADHATSADSATTADHATTADSATTANGVSDSVKQYIRNQNILAKQEVITINNTNVTMQYDGFLTFRGSTNQVFELYINDVLYAHYAFSYGYYENTSLTIPVKKGDKVRRSNTSWSEIHARFYKLRDYTGR